MDINATQVMQALAIVLNAGREAAVRAEQDQLAEVLAEMTGTAVALGVTAPRSWKSRFEDLRYDYGY